MKTPRFSRVHAICAELRRKPCELCPHWIATPYGHGMRGCYWHALEVINIARNGHPWDHGQKRKHIRAWRKEFNQQSIEYPGDQQ